MHYQDVKYFMANKYQDKFLANHLYHIYNRTNNRELLFRTDENRRFFLFKLQQFLGGFIDFHAYSLLPNHFHLLIRIKDIKAICDHLQNRKVDDLTLTERKFLQSVDQKESIDLLITAQFNRFFNSYSKSFNTFYLRRGNLFERSFKRSVVISDARLMSLHHYIARNAELHHIVKDIEHHRWNSHFAIRNGQDDWLAVDSIFRLFGGREAYLAFLNRQEGSKEFLNT